MKKMPKRDYPTEFKEMAIKRVKDGQSVGAAADVIEHDVESLVARL